MAAIKSATDKLKKALQEAGASLYKGAGGGQAGPGGPGAPPDFGAGAPGNDAGGPTGGPGGDNVYDADFKKA